MEKVNWGVTLPLWISVLMSIMAQILSTCFFNSAILIRNGNRISTAEGNVTTEQPGAVRHHPVIVANKEHAVIGCNVCELRNTQKLKSFFQSMLSLIGRNSLHVVCMCLLLKQVIN